MREICQGWWGWIRRPWGPRVARVVPRPGVAGSGIAAGPLRLSLVPAASHSHRRCVRPHRPRRNQRRRRRCFLLWRRLRRCWRSVWAPARVSVCEMATCPCQHCSLLHPVLHYCNAQNRPINNHVSSNYPHTYILLGVFFFVIIRRPEKVHAHPHLWFHRISKDQIATISQVVQPRKKTCAQRERKREKSKEIEERERQR